MICQSPNCRTEFCFKCRLEWHENKTCKQNKKALLSSGKISSADSASLKFLQSERSSQQCPNCNLWANKVDGCDWVRCAFCSHEFCWSCLRPHDHNMSKHRHGSPAKQLGKNILIGGGVVLVVPLAVPFFLVFGLGYVIYIIVKK